MGPLAVDEAAGLAGTLAGFRVLARQSAPRLLVALLGAQWVVIGALDILFVILAVDVLYRGEGWVGYLSMAYGVGGVLAGLAGGALAGRRWLLPPILGGVVLIGAALGLNALSTTAAATVVLWWSVAVAPCSTWPPACCCSVPSRPRPSAGCSAWPRPWRWRGWPSGRRWCR
jgi:hypothetical protein